MYFSKISFTAAVLQVGRLAYRGESHRWAREQHQRQNPAFAFPALWLNLWRAICYKSDEPVSCSPQRAYTTDQGKLMRISNDVILDLLEIGNVNQSLTIFFSSRNFWVSPDPVLGIQRPHFQGAYVDLLGILWVTECYFSGFLFCSPNIFAYLFCSPDAIFAAFPDKNG